MTSSDTAQRFLSQARHHLNDDYLPKIRRCLEVLSPEDVWWRAHGNTNSIGNLILHLCGNVRQWIVSGLGGEEDRRRRPAEFSRRRPLPKDQLLEMLETTVREATQVLDSLSEQDLATTRRIQVYDVTGLQAILHVVEHFAYHTGQIIYITRLRKNVDLKFYDLP